MIIKAWAVPVNVLVALAEETAWLKLWQTRLISPSSPVLAASLPIFISAMAKSWANRSSSKAYESTTCLVVKSSYNLASEANIAKSVRILRNPCASNCSEVTGSSGILVFTSPLSGHMFFSAGNRKLELISGSESFAVPRPVKLNSLCVMKKHAAVPIVCAPPDETRKFFCYYTMVETWNDWQWYGKGKIIGIPVRRTRSCSESPLFLNLDFRTSIGSLTSGKSNASAASEIVPSLLPVSTS